MRLLHTTLVSVLLAGSASAQPVASLTVHVVLNEPDAGGVLRLAVCPDKRAYDREEGCVVRSVAATARVVTCAFDSLETGTCAVKVFHDINGDGKLNTSWIGWPQEPYGFSNDAPVNMGPPPFKLAAIPLKAGGNTTRILLR